MRYLTRNKLYQKLEPFKTAKKIYIFCEGQKREVDYFIFFQGLSSNIDIIPIPSEDGKTDPEKLKNNANARFFGNDEIDATYKLSKEYEDEVWFVIDTDRWNEDNKINELKSYVKEKNDKHKSWFVAQSNPSFEIWLYYHFFQEKPNSEEVSKCISFKDYIDFKIKGGFDIRKMPLEIQSAIHNSEINFEIDNEQPKLFSTEVFHLGKLIVQFTKNQIDKCFEAIG